MEFQDVVRRRHMVRTFTSEPVPQASVDRILGNAVRGPSAGFSQGQAFLVLSGEDLPKFWAVASEAVSESAQTAPLLIVPMSAKRVYLDRYAEPDKGWTDRDEAHWPVPYWHIDTGMAALLLLLAAHDAGLAACFFGVPSEHWPALFAAFDIPDRLAPVGVVSLGYPAPDVRSPSLKRGRRKLDEVVRYGSFGPADAAGGPAG